MSETPSPEVRATDLVKSYPAGRARPPVRALDGLSLEVPAGSVLALVGPNGAGKSTTVKILTTLARPDGGAAVVAGVDVLRDPAAVRNRIGLVAQRPGSDPMATGRENLALTGRIHGLSRRDARARADELLTRFALAAAADRLTRTWSGGMARKLDVALGLVHRPRVLFLDEPTTGLDPEARAELWREIDTLRRSDGVTVVLTTHYLDEADALADRVAIVDAGRVVVSGSPEDLKNDLRGDRVEIELVAGASQTVAAAALGRVVGVSAVTVDRGRLLARAESGARAVPAVLAALEGSGVAAESVRIARPSLDDVYLRHVGRAFDDTATEGKAA